MVDITLIGNAGAVPLPDRALTAAVLTVNGRSILFDCGEGTQVAGRRAGVNLMRTDVIALTHYHGDHIFGIPGLLQSLDLGGREAPLYIVGPVRPGWSIETELAPILMLTGRLSYEIRLVTMPENGLDLHKLSPEWPDLARLDAFRTTHRVVSQGYVFTLGRRGRFLPEKAGALGIPKQLWGVLQRGSSVNMGGNTVYPGDVMDAPRKGLKVLFSGDTAYCPNLVRAGEGADLMICEATYGDNAHASIAAEYGHMTFSDAGKAAQEAGAARLWLTHFSQRMYEPEEYLHFARDEFPAAECGTDGKTLTLEFGDK